MKFSIITVTFNAGDLLKKTIESVAMQDYTELEYIIIDGGSTDNTKILVNNYSTLIRKFVSEKDKGIYDAMNKGIRFAEGDYCIFMNAGDCFNNSTVLTELTSFIDACGYEPAIVVGRAVYTSTSGAELVFVPNISKVPYHFCHQSMLFKTDIIKQEPYDYKYKLSGDSELLYRLVTKGFKMVQTDVVVSNNLIGVGATYSRLYESAQELFSIPELKSQLSGIYIKYRLFKIRLVVLLRKIGLSI